MKSGYTRDSSNDCLSILTRTATTALFSIHDSHISIYALLPEAGLLSASTPVLVVYPL